MGTTLTKSTSETSERSVDLRDRAASLERLVWASPEAGRRAAVVLDKHQQLLSRVAWYEQIERIVIDLSQELPEGPDDYDVRKLFEFMLALRRAVEEDPDGKDAAGEVELAKMRMGDVAHRIGRRLLHGQLDDPRIAADYVFGALQGVAVGEVARLLGVSTKTVHAWRSGRPVARNVRRVVTVAQVLSHLRASMTSLGLVMWFDAPRDQLGERTPLQMLDEDTERARPVLIELARGVRGQLAD